MLMRVVVNCVRVRGADTKTLNVRREEGSERKICTLGGWSDQNMGYEGLSKNR